MIEFIIIAILQGLFEWLPISSSGQVMIIAMNLFGIPPDKAFSLAIWLHLGTTFAVLLKFRTDFYKIAKSFFPSRREINEIDIKNRNWLIIATIGTAITALPLYLLFKTILAESYTPMQGDIITLIIAGLLIITGTILLIARKLYGTKSIDEITKRDLRRDSFITGLMQGIAILPGISRSGITVSTILFEKYDQNNALKLSFLMSVPASIASILVDIFFGEGSIFGFLDPLTIIVITLISFIIGYLMMEILLRIAKKVNFGYFCIVYGIIAYMIIIPFIVIS